MYSTAGRTCVQSSPDASTARKVASSSSVPVSTVMRFTPARTAASTISGAVVSGR